MERLVFKSKKCILAKNKSMARLDKYHLNVKIALENDGWEVTHDPYVLKLKDDDEKVSNYPIDLGAEKVIAAQRGTEKIAVEVKTFESSSVINEYHKALGQYMDYLAGLEIQEPNRKLYLALSTRAYQDLMKNPLSKLSINRFSINLLIVDIETNKITKWIG